MRQIRPERFAHRARGFTLIEMVVAIVLVSIIVATTIFFVYPVRQAADLATRAELTDIADNALQRIGREARLALPNSVRVTSSGSTFFVEFLPLRTAGRYRADVGGVPSGSNCPDTGIGQPGSDQLSYSPVVDTCFKTIGTVADASTITTSDFLVLNNYGPGFNGQNAYDTSGTLNRRQISAAADEGTRERISFISATAFDLTLHDSPGKRFYIVNGNASTALPEPVTYECNPTAGTLTRRWGYTMVAAQPTSFGSGTSTLIANDVTFCDFNYDSNGVGAQIGLLTLKLNLSKTLSGGEVETVSLYHSVHVNNVP
jgi:MSHA biogenesis protein MshO